MELRLFDWRSASILNLATEGTGNLSGNNNTVEILPGPDFVSTLLSHTDRIYALAIQAAVENPYVATNAENNNANRMTIEEWWSSYYQLEWEISKAEKEVETLTLNARAIFDEANSYIVNDDTSDKISYLRAFRGLCATYMDALEQISMYLQQVRESSWKLRCYVLSSSTNN